MIGNDWLERSQTLYVEGGWNWKIWTSTISLPIDSIVTISYRQTFCILSTLIPHYRVNVLLCFAQSVHRFNGFCWQYANVSTSFVHHCIKLHICRRKHETLQPSTPAPPSDAPYSSKTALIIVTEWEWAHCQCIIFVRDDVNNPIMATAPSAFRVRARRRRRQTSD